MLRAITWDQFLEWAAYDRLEPIGDRRGDMQAASVCAAIANFTMIAHGSKKRYRVSDFLLNFSDEVKPLKEMREGQSWQEMRFITQMCAAESNAPPRKTRQRR